MANTPYLCPLTDRAVKTAKPPFLFTRLLLFSFSGCFVYRLFGLYFWVTLCIFLFFIFPLSYTHICVGLFLFAFLLVFVCFCLHFVGFFLVLMGYLS